MSPIVKNWALRSACLARNALTSFCSQSLTACCSAATSLSSSKRFMGMFSVQRLVQKLARRRVRIGAARGERFDPGCLVRLEMRPEPLEQQVLRRLLQTEGRDATRPGREGAPGPDPPGAPGARRPAGEC